MMDVTRSEVGFGWHSSQGHARVHEHSALIVVIMAASAVHISLMRAQDRQCREESVGGTVQKGPAAGAGSCAEHRDELSQQRYGGAAR